MYQAIVLGASGLVGQKLIECLSTDQRFAGVHAVLRRPFAGFSQKVTVHEFDFQNWDKLRADLQNSAKSHEFIAFSALGTTIKVAGSREAFRRVDLDFVFEFAKVAKDLDCEKFGVVSAMGANSHSKIFYNQVKGEMEQALQQLNFNHLVIVRPSLLLGNRSEFRLGEKLATHVTGWLQPLLKGPLKSMRPVEDWRVAHSLIDAVTSNKTGTEILENSQLFSSEGRSGKLNTKIS